MHTNITYYCDIFKPGGTGTGAGGNEFSFLGLLRRAGVIIHVIAGVGKNILQE